MKSTDFYISEFFLVLIRGIIMISPSDIFTGDTAAFRTKLYELWFENYDRASSGSALGSRLMNVFNFSNF